MRWIWKNVSSFSYVSFGPQSWKIYIKAGFLFCKEELRKVYCDLYIGYHYDYGDPSKKQKRPRNL